MKHRIIKRTHATGRVEFIVEHLANDFRNGVYWEAEDKTYETFEAAKASIVALTRPTDEVVGEYCT